MFTHSVLSRFPASDTGRTITFDGNLPNQTFNSILSPILVFFPDQAGCWLHTINQYG